MRIAMFSDNFYPELSGISDSIIESARELSRLGHQVDIYAPRYSKKDFFRYNTPAQELDLGEKIKIHRFFSVRYPAPTGQGRMVIPTFLRWLSISKNKPDVIHTHLFFGVGMEGLVASKLLKIPLVGTSHTPMSEFVIYGPIQSKFLEKRILRFVSWYYNKCDFVTAPSQSIISEMKENGFKKPCIVMSNPIDLKNFHLVNKKESNKLRQKYGLSNFTVLYTGRLASEKHIDVIIQAIELVRKKIPQINFAVTGHGKARESLERMAKKLGLERNVKFFGTVSAEDHSKIYQAADVFVIASTAETQSLGLMKAMATGLPVIGVNARALPEYINKENGFIVEPGDYNRMADKIVFLSEHPESREALGKKGLESVQKFSPENIAKEWASLYHKIYANFYKK